MKKLLYLNVCYDIIHLLKILGGVLVGNFKDYTWFYIFIYLLILDRNCIDARVKTARINSDYRRKRIVFR